MHVQIVSFQLKDMTGDQYRAMCDELAPAFAEAPGLVSKVWLADPVANTFGGIYLWEHHAAFDAFTKSDLFNAVATHPKFTGITSRDFEVLDGPTKVTRGMAAVSA